LRAWKAALLGHRDAALEQVLRRWAFWFLFGECKKERSRPIGTIPYRDNF